VQIMLLVPALFIVVGFAYVQSHPSRFAKKAPPGQTARSSSQNQAKPKLLALLFRADWCSTCKRLEREYEPLQQSLVSEPILFARFDFTDHETAKEARELAAKLGIERIFRQAEGKAGFALLVKPSTKRLVGAIKDTHTPNQLRAAFTDALEQEIAAQNRTIA